MFCNQCGSELANGDHFCSKCGTPVALATTPALATPSSEPHPDHPLSFGTPVDRWWLQFDGKTAFPSGYEWLSQRNTLFVCRHHLVLIQGDEKRSAALDIVQAMGLAGALVGAVRGIKDTLLNRKLEIFVEVAERLFADELLVWCKKADAVIWRYREKPWMFIKSSSEQLYCKFQSTAGVLHACAVLWCTAQYTGHAKGDIDGFGCEFVDVGFNLPEKQVPEAMKASRMQLPS